MLQILRNHLGSIIPSFVKDNRDLVRFGIRRFDLRKQRNGGCGVDGVVKTDLGGHRLDINRTVDIQTLTTGVAFDLHLLAPLDPATAQDGIVLRVGRIHE